MIKAFLASIVLLVAIGLVGNTDRVTELQESMIHTCSQQPGPRCQNLISAVQADGKHEVLSREGSWWVETK